MIRGLYIGASGMLAELRRTDLIANNLANVSTNGYRRDELVEESFPELLFRRWGDGKGASSASGSLAPPVGRMGFGAVAVASVTDWEPGGLTETGNPLDLALTGEGLFTVQTPNGLRYTRDGAFTRDREGYLVTLGGYRVLGEKGPLRLGAGKVEVGPDGMVSVDGAALDRLRLARFPKGAGLRKEGQNLFAAVGGVEQQADAATEVHQGALERSNVNTVKEMVSLIASMRAYETNQRLIQMEDELMQKAAGEVGRV